MAYGNEPFAYDTIGNPTTYRGKNATWQNGRQLTAYNGTTFAYDARGRRTQKNTLKFTYDSKGNLLKQSNGRTPSFDKAMMHGGFVALEGITNFVVGGIIGSVGTIGTKGKFFVSAEWWGKLMLGLEMTQPIKIIIDYIRKNLK